MSDYVPGIGSFGSKLMILGEAPSYREVAEGKPFVGPSGRELDTLLKDAGISRSSCWLTNVCKYMVTPNAKGKKIPFAVRAKNDGIDIAEQLSELQSEINQIKPNCILALGSTALWALSSKTKISSFRGSIMHGMGVKFVPTYHPAHLLHQAAGGEIKGYWNRQVMVLDFKRAHAQSEYPDLILPHRNLHICQSSYELWEFYERYKHLPEVSVDIEAGGSCIPICVGLAFNEYHGLCVPLWNRDNISHMSDPDMVNCWRLLTEILSNHDIIGHNFNYDRDKLRRLGFETGKLRDDTMLKAFTINPELPKGLAFLTSIYTEEPFYKDEGMYEGELRDLFIGCGRDACVTFEVDKKMDTDIAELELKDFYENFVMKLPDFYLEIENNGFHVNEAKRQKLLEKYIAWDERLRHELFELTGAYINVGSPKQVYILLFETLKFPRRDGTGEEELTSLLNLQSFTDPNKRRIVELILEDRRVRRTISHDIMALPDYDGRMKTTCFPCLETGRSSNGQQDPPIRPSIEVTGEDGKKKKKSLGTPFQTKTKHGDIGPEVRSMYEPAKGHIFVQADSAQAEARVVFLLADDEQALKDIDEHDYHALTASWFFGGSESDYSKKVHGVELPIRFAGKTLRHAGHLGAKERRAAIEVNTQARKYNIPITITEAIARHALAIFHQKQPKIQAIFHRGVQEALGCNRMLTAPIPYGFKSKYGGRRIFYERWGDDLFREAYSYLPQRAVTDNTKGAGIRIKQQFPWAKIILEAHDALVFEILESELDNFAPIVKVEMERPIIFDNCTFQRRELIIPCEIEVGYNYEDLIKLSKFKSQQVVNSL